MNALWKICALVGFGLAAALTAAADAGKYSIAVVPQYPAVAIHRDWTPVLERLKKETGYSFSLSIAPSIPAFEESVLAGEPDFAYMNPYHEVMAMRAQGYIPLLRGSQPLTGILVVRRDDPIKSPRELDGKEVAFPAPNAFGASLWMRALLAEHEKIHITPVYLKTHSNTYRHVVLGLVVAGGGVNHTLKDEPEEIRQSLRVLYETPGVPPHPLSAHPRVPGKVRRAVAGAMLEMANDTAGAALLKDIQLETPVRADYARDYRPLEKYGLDKYVVRAAKP